MVEREVRENAREDKGCDEGYKMARTRGSRGVGGRERRERVKVGKRGESSDKEKERDARRGE